MEAPIEVRISGDDVGELKRLGEQVQGILESVSNTQYVFRDYFNDSYRVDVKVNDELANRLGMNGRVGIANPLRGIRRRRSQHVLGRGPPGHHQAATGPGLRAHHFADIGNTYVNSELTHARVPLRAVAQLAPEWQTSRIVRRNGVRTLTIRAFPKPGALRLENPGEGNAEDQGIGIAGWLPDHLRRRKR